MPRLAAILVLLGLGAWTPVRGDPVPRLILTETTRLRLEAQVAMRLQNWDRALDLSLQILATSQRPNPELRDQIRLCLRNVSQFRRQRDPAFQMFVLSLSSSDALNLYAEVLGKLREFHLHRDRASAARLYALGLAELDRALGDEAFRERHLDSPSLARVESFRRDLREIWATQRPTNPREARSTVREMLQSAQASLATRTPAALIFELMCGACSGLDEFTVVLSPTGPQADLVSTIQMIAEYGMLVRTDTTGLVVEGVLAGSWVAEQTSVQKGQRIVRWNGRELGLGLEADLVSALQQPGLMGHELVLVSGSEMTMRLRLPVPLPTVFESGPTMMAPKDLVAQIRISSFRDSTPREFDEALHWAKMRGARALIIDLRNNTGGQFAAAVAVAQRLLPQGIIATTQGTVPEFASRIFSSDSGLSAIDLPVVVLVDTRTLSSAELVAAAWKDHNRALVIGTPTFGKGTIQSPLRLSAADHPKGPARSGVLNLTVASFQPPRGMPIQGQGVQPHILEPDPTKQVDLAMIRALELARGMR